MSYIGKIKKDDKNQYRIGSSLYGTCTTAADIPEKVVSDMPDFDILMKGITIHIKFTNSNELANPTLNINNTGAIAIASPTGVKWKANQVLGLTYDGSSWQMNGSSESGGEQGPGKEEIFIGTEEPTDENIVLWIDPSTKQEINISEINDNITNTTTTWSSNKIKQEINNKTVKVVVDDTLSTTSENPVQNKTITSVLNNKQNMINSTNKIDYSFINNAPNEVTEDIVQNWGFTKNTGTVTSIEVQMNGETKGTITSNGTIDLGTVLTEHQDITGKQNKLIAGNNITISEDSIINAEVPEIIIDTTMSLESENPVQNKAVTAYVNAAEASAKTYADKIKPNLTNYLDKSSTTGHKLKANLQIGDHTLNVVNAFLHIRKVTSSITGFLVNGICASVNADGTASFMHKTYNNDGSGAKNAAILRFSNKGIQFAVNSGSGNTPSESDFKTVGTIDNTKASDTDTWSSKKIQEEINKAVQAALGAQNLSEEEVD